MNQPYQNVQINPNDLSSFIQAGQIPNPLNGRSAKSSYWDNNLSGNGTFIAYGGGWYNDADLIIPGSSSGVNSTYDNLDSGFALIIAPYEPDNESLTGQYGLKVFHFKNKNSGTINNSGVLIFNGVQDYLHPENTSIFTNSGTILNIASKEDDDSLFQQSGGTFNNTGNIRGKYTAGDLAQTTQNNYNFEWGTFTNTGVIALDFYEYVTIGKYKGSPNYFDFQKMEFNHNGIFDLSRATDPKDNKNSQQANISILGNGTFNLNAELTNSMSGEVFNNWGVFNGGKGVNGGKGGQWIQEEGVATIRNAQGYLNPNISDEVLGYITGTHEFFVQGSPGTDTGIKILNDAIISPGGRAADDKIGKITMTGEDSSLTSLTSTYRSGFEFDVLGKEANEFDSIIINDGNLILQDNGDSGGPELTLNIASGLTLGKGEQIDLFTVVGGKIEGSFLSNSVKGLGDEFQLQQSNDIISLIAANL